MKTFLLTLFVAAVAAAPKGLKDATHEIIVPGPAILPEPVLPEIVPAPVILPEPVLPEIVPEPVILPAPVLPEIVPDPVILPEPVLPELVEIEPELPIVVEQPDLPIVVEQPEEPIIIEEKPEIIEDIPVVPEIPNGEIFNDGIVQVTVNTPPEVSMLSSLQSWFSMVLNYFNNGIHTSNQIV